MKAEFELSLDISGKPCIKFKHYDKDNSLDQKTLKLFIDLVKEKGMDLRNTSGFISGSDSFEYYEIQIKNV